MKRKLSAMTVKLKIAATVSAVIIVSCATFVYMKSPHARSGVVKSIESGVCTMDFPPSSCGSSKVVISGSGGQNTYTVKGFIQSRSENYEKIMAKMHESMEDGSTVKFFVEGNTLVRVD